MYTSTKKMANGNDQSEESVENTLLMKMYPALQRYCRFLSRNKWDGDDLAQEAIIKASQSYHQSDINSALLNKIAYHHWIDTVRKRKREVAAILDDLSDRNERSIPDRLIDVVNLLMDNLTPKQAVIFMLKEAFRYQAKEIANLLDTTEMAVKSSLHRAKKRLNKEEVLHSVDSFWDEKEKQVLYELLYKSLQAEDPQILITMIPKIPSLTDGPRRAKGIRSSSSLTSYCMAA